MARTAPQRPERVMTSDEQRLIRYFQREGFKPERLEYAARKAKMTREKAERLLNRLQVREEIQRRTNWILAEQIQIDARDLNRKIEVEDQQDLATRELVHREYRRMVVMTPEQLEKAPSGVLAKERLLVLGLVTNGEIRSGKLERVAPLEGAGQKQGDIYEAVWLRRQTQAAPLMPDAPEDGKDPEALGPAPPAPPAQPAAPPPAADGRPEVYRAGAQK